MSRYHKRNMRKQIEQHYRAKREEAIRAFEASEEGRKVKELAEQARAELEASNE